VHRVTFSGMALDRAAELRSDPAQLARLVRDGWARAIVASAGGVLLERGGVELARTPLSLLGSAAPESSEAILLGLEAGRALFAVDLETLDPPTRRRLLEGRRIAALREAGAILSHSEAGLAAYAVALINWHGRHPHCSVCGTITQIAEGGYSRRCPACGATHFPRTDPAVIVLVHCGDRALLGRRPDWPEGQYSVLAGFVSPGESAEEAVKREVLEESGVTVDHPVFVTSQPWPFPSSLMLGFEASSDGGEPEARDAELEDVRWFTRAEVGAALGGDGDRLRVPPSVSIARFLIERWYQGSVDI
jgi:NAD+ diphosphatase